MSATYNGNAGSVSAHGAVAVTNPTDGDALTATSNNSAIETLANQVQHLKTSALLRDQAGGDAITGRIDVETAARIRLKGTSVLTDETGVASAGFTSGNTKFAGIGGFETAGDYEYQGSNVEHKFISCADFHNTAGNILDSAEGLVFQAPSAGYFLWAKLPLPRPAVLQNVDILIGSAGAVAGSSIYWGRVEPVDATLTTVPARTYENSGTSGGYSYTPGASQPATWVNGLPWRASPVYTLAQKGFWFVGINLAEDTLFWGMRIRYNLTKLRVEQ